MQKKAVNFKTCILYYYILLQNPNDPTILSSWRQVAFVDDFFDILKDIHCEEKGHIESKKTLEEVHAFDVEFLAVLLLSCDLLLLIFPLMRKSAAEVAINLQNHVFAVLGTSQILHSDNGWEFVNDNVHSIIKEWPAQVTIVNGRPQNPKCLGLVEQGNGMIEKLLRAHLHKHEGDNQPTWSE